MQNAWSWKPPLEDPECPVPRQAWWCPVARPAGSGCSRCEFHGLRGGSGFVQFGQLMGWSAAGTLSSCSAKTRRPKARFKEYHGLAGGNKDGKRSIQRFRNVISEMVFRDRPVYRGEGERMSIMARSL
jgi:hypothetical protein